MIAVGGLLVLPELPGMRIGGAFGTRLIGQISRELVPGTAAPTKRVRTLPALPARRRVAALASNIVAGVVDLTLVTLASLLATLPLTLAYFRHLRDLPSLRTCSSSRRWAC